MVKVLVFGGFGWIGGHYHHYFSSSGRRGEFSSVASSADIASREQIKRELVIVRPDVVINAAGKTGRPNIDWCETNREVTFEANVTGPKILAEECQKLHIKLVHLSTGDIFDGYDKKYTEEDESVPFGQMGYYAETKVLAERELAKFPDTLILRLRMPISDEVINRNLITKLSGYKRVVSVANSVTVMNSLMVATEELVRQWKNGVFHVVNPGAVTHQQILELYDQIVDPKHKGIYQIISSVQLNEQTKARRLNCVLSTAKLEKAGIVLPSTIDAIERCLLRYAENFRRPVYKTL